MRTRVQLLLAGLGALLAWAVADAWRLRWVGDDAFISFRYARNLVRGLGLVFNAGERVEGYTNFLWTLLVAGGMRLGADPVVFTMVAGIACFAGTLLLLARTSLRAATAVGRAPLPLAFVGFAFIEHARIFATSGLETASFVLLVTATLIGAVEAASPRAWLGVGALGTLCALTRPDGALYYALAGGVAAWDAARTRRPGALLAVALPGLGVLLPWAGWKLHYYGSLLPNTFYAKSAGHSWWDQGNLYLQLWFRTYWALLPGLLALPAVGWLRRREPDAPGWGGWRGPALLGVASALALLYVAKVGGDFMFGRFCLPVTPALLLGIELAALRLPRVGGWLAVAGVAGALTVGRAYPEALRDREGALAELGIEGIVEEREWYPEGYVALAREKGEHLRGLLAGTDARVLILGSQAMLAYYADFPYALEGAGGLTDAEIARRWSGERTRVGHKGDITVEYLQSRDVDLWVVFVPIGEELLYYSWSRIELGAGVNGMIISYRKELLDTLRARGARFRDGGDTLDEYATHLPTIDDSKARLYLETFRGWYFDHTDDPAREAVFRARVERVTAGAGALPPPATPTGAPPPSR